MADTDRREQRKRQRNLRTVLTASAIGFIGFLYYMNKSTMAEYIVTPEQLNRHKEAVPETGKLWTDLSRLLPPVTKDTLGKLPVVVTVTDEANVALKKCFDLLAKDDPWTAQPACEEAVLRAGNDPRAYVGRAYSYLPKPTTKPARDDLNIACGRGIPEACDWAKKLPQQ